MKRDHASSTRGDLDADGLRFALVVARFNPDITETLLEGARSCLVEHGADPGALDVIRVPGAWELPLAASRLAALGRYQGVVAIGCVIRGETPHFDFVAGEAARGLGRVALDHGLPVAFGVLTTDTLEQARARAGGHEGNKGWDAALACLEMAVCLRDDPFPGTG